MQKQKLPLYVNNICDQLMTFLKFGSGVSLSPTVSEGPECLWAFWSWACPEWCSARLANPGFVIQTYGPALISLYLHRSCTLRVLFLTTSDLSPIVCIYCICMYVYILICYIPASLKALLLRKFHGDYKHWRDQQHHKKLSQWVV